MQNLFYHRSSWRAMGLALLMTALGAFVMGAGGPQAQAQPPPNTPPGVDHYLVYPVLNPPSFTIPVVLSDQFSSQVPHQTYTMDYFMIPVDKNGEGILDPITHYTWWRINPVSFQATAVISNQFGAAQPFDIREATYLLNPALKNMPGVTIPLKNHFQVYVASSPLIPIPPVSLVDQFYPYQAQVRDARWLALPAEKRLPTRGEVFPMLDPVGHLAIYRIILVNPPPTIPSPLVQDEFGTWQLLLDRPTMLCVPSYKTGVTDIPARSWGELRRLYR